MTINVFSTVRVGNGSTLGPADASITAEDIVINVGGRLVRFGAGVHATMKIYAPNARMSMGRTARMAGTFCVDRLNTDHSTVLQCP